MEKQPANRVQCKKKRKKDSGPPVVPGLICRPTEKGF